ncbi:hypothetical protein FQN60_011575 [Etheostoma spectabile]|uniref:Uncharacterized protein n=1 Tax=Etheostoma spectabile TaxID=54343 RepID=A0A5J5DME2_9PERO|nr:hypothetical protein FQN60_011575 [Etheostoma spectabile]
MHEILSVHLRWVCMKNDMTEAIEAKLVGELQSRHLAVPMLRRPQLRLSGLLRHLLPADQDIQRELWWFNVDLTVPSFKEGVSIMKWWGHVFVKPDKYPSLSMMGEDSHAALHKGGCEVRGDRTLCKNINSAAAMHKRQQKMNKKQHLVSIRPVSEVNVTSLHASINTAFYCCSI